MSKHIINKLSFVKGAETYTLDNSGCLKAVNGIPAGPDGNCQVDKVDYASNILATDAKASSGEFVYRTTDGFASISDGNAKLSTVYGGRVHNNYIPEVLSMTVHNATRTQEGDDEISAIIDRDIFVAYVNNSATITLEYTSAWSANPALYGVTVDGTPINGDSITITYIKESRGTIVMATPANFNSTGWNLYNYANGYARVLKYSDIYGFRIDGDYTDLEFSETIDGAHSVIVPDDNGLFTIPSDGYIWVIDPDEDTTCIYMTWSNWINGHAGDFEVYDESTIDFTSIMANFPYGLCQVGVVRDYISFELAQAVSMIDRVAYSAANLAAAKASGRPYEYDQNYIYIVRENPVIYPFLVNPNTGLPFTDGSYKANDHGMEFFGGTTVACRISALYGQNLKDKLRTDVVTISEQTLTPDQQAQVRTNIGAFEESDVAPLFLTESITFFDNFTVEPSGSYQKTYASTSVDKPGYRCLGLVGCGIANATTSGGYCSFVFLSDQRYISGTGITIRFRNVHTSHDAVIKGIAQLLYVKT